MSQSSRINFTPSTVDKIAKAAMYICSRPDCLRLTGYTTTEGKARAIAEAAHINAASKKGPRADSKLTDTQLKSVTNGIWLCLPCHDMIDADVSGFPTDELKRWKKAHQDILRRIVGKDLEVALLELRSARQYHEECREFLSFLESKRVLYEGLDHEFPYRVKQSMDLIRERVAIVRARVSPDSNVFLALNKVQEATHTFLRAIGPRVDLENLRCDSTDPTWRKFADELQKFRSGVIIIMKVLAGDADYRLTWV